ncbi:hypothetical protein Cgig2_000011 [Carnegiea gigantea]|uniref:CCT domain-containing protein n=1 Tax=Carnegiea gigantea TaxID=171969 RepID=A0A9Q1Q7K0_9CARY|nr:hypothetical protein Cgig2_000011 [Carnegiea gigantea]
MSSDIFVLDEPYLTYLNSNMLYPEISDNFFTGPLSEISDSIDTLLQEILSDDYCPNSDQLTTQIPADETHFLDQISHTHFSNSPPSRQFETMSLSQQLNEQQNQTHLANLQISCNLASGCDNQSVLEIESEDFHLGFNSTNYNSYLMQRSFSYGSNSFDEKSHFLFQPSVDAHLEVHNFQGMDSVENENGFVGNQIRRVYSTGNLPEVRMNQMAEGSVRVSSAFGEGGRGERISIEEANSKVGRYSAEERKERIDRYRAKRTQRNFNKTIKYACRKTLADSRARVRGRFARNDETGEVNKCSSCFHPSELKSMMIFG